MNSPPSPSLSPKRKREGHFFGDAVAFFLRGFREREHFSLDLHTIQPLAVFETRRRTALRGEGFAWVPDLWSFLKLQEVGVSPYLSFIPIFSTFRMFESIEAV